MNNQNYEQPQYELPKDEHPNYHLTMNIHEYLNMYEHPNCNLTMNIHEYLHMYEHPKYEHPKYEHPQHEMT